jgi:hypothetical protein
MTHEIVCTYCGENADYKAIIQKPSTFIFDTYTYELVNIQTDKKDLICLECLDFEINEMIENH